jgi:hypothetical protein
MPINKELPMPLFRVIFAIILAVLITAAGAFGQVAKGDEAVPVKGAGSKAPVSVKDVKFTQTKLGGQIYPWNRMQIELQANFNPASADPKAIVNKRYVDKIKVTATQIYKNTSKDAKDWNYYRASATVLTMEVQQPRSVVFYLPGDIVKRDVLHKEPDYYFVQIEVGGNEVPLFDAAGKIVADHARAVHKDIAKKTDFDNAKDAADRGVGVSAGILRPQYLVLYGDTVIVPPSPEFIREDVPTR